MSAPPSPSTPQSGPETAPETAPRQDCTAETPSTGTAMVDDGAGQQGQSSDTKTTAQATENPKENGGRGGPDPTRYGDWEKAGRCIDF